MTTIYSGETDNRIMTVMAPAVTVEVHLDSDYMGFPVPDPAYLTSAEARILAEALLAAAELVPA